MKTLEVLFPHSTKETPVEAWTYAYSAVIERLRTESLIPIGPLEVKETVATVTPSIAEGFPTDICFTRFQMKVRRESGN